MRSKAYWVRRTADLEKAMQEDARSAAESIIKAYERSIENINNDIRNIFKTYVVNGIPEKEAVGLLNAAERDKTYRELLSLYQNTANPQAKAEIANRINAQAYGARISRLEGVKARIYTRLAEAANYSERTQQTLYTNTLQSSYYTNIYNIAKGINAGIDFTVLPKNAIERVLNEPWFGGNYSSRIWKHNDEFVKTLQETLESGIMEGHSVNRMAEQMLDFINDGVNSIRMNTERLVRSETAHFMNQGQLAAYEEIGIEKYQFVAALSERTCDICGNLDSEMFDVAAAIEGENYPPMHANCRCTTVMAGAVPETRIARNPETGETYKVDGDMSFNEWKNSLTDEQRAALKYVDKSAKSDIIKESKSSRPITIITDKAIEKIPIVSIPGYSETECNHIQAQHQELLRYSQIKNKSKEVSFVFNRSFSTKQEFSGSEDRINYGHSLMGRDLFIMHNHPRNKSYSANDIRFFKDFDGVKTLTIVKNNGEIEYLTKSCNYNQQTFKLEYDRMYKKVVKNGTDAEMDRFVERLLSKTKSGVIWSGKK